MEQKTTEEEWRALLTGEHRGMLALRRQFGRFPSAPRCKLCYAPFHGIGGALLKPWFGPWERHPQLCKNCMKGLTKQGVGGAEHASLDVTGLDRRTVEVRGREATLDVYALRPQ